MMKKSHFIIFWMLIFFVLCPSSFAMAAIYWGDLHCHSAFSDDGYIIQINKGLTPQMPASSLDYARNTAKLDFMAFTDHAEFLELYRDNHGNLIKDNAGAVIDEWQNTVQLMQDSENLSDIIVFAGFEYTKTAEDENRDPVTGAGHKCVIFRDNRLPLEPISSVSGAPANDPNPYAALPTDLWRMLDATNAPYITIPHHPAKGASAPISPETSMITDWDYVNAKNQPLVEIFSVHGSSDYSGCPDPVDGFVASSSVEAALNLWLTRADPGYKLGIVGSTDGHLSRPGSVEPESIDNMVHQEGDYTGGLVAVIAPEKSRDAIWNALTQKSVYGTSGPRIKINLFRVSTGTMAAAMGQTLSLFGNQPLPVSIEIDVETDTADAELLAVTKSTTDEPVSAGVLTATGLPWVLQTVADHSQCTTWDGKHVSITLSDSIDCPRTYYRLTIRQLPTTRYTWSINHYIETTTRERAWSSPIFIEKYAVAYADPQGTFGLNPAYTSLQQACNQAAGDPDWQNRLRILAVADDFPEDITLTRDIAVILQGGFNDTFTAVTGKTSLSSLTITSGSITPVNLIIE